MILKIKKMESSKFKTTVMHEINKLGLQNISVELDEVGFKGNISHENIDRFDSALKDLGFELLVDKRRLIIAEIKDAVYQLVYLTDDLPEQIDSDYISKKINIGYSSIGYIFSSRENNTIEDYILLQRNERVKELLIYSDINLNEIASKMHFDSEAHLSNEFKKITGLTPSFYRSSRNIQN